MPAKAPPTIFSRRMRFCFLVRAALPLGLPVGRLPGGRGGVPLPPRDAVVRARPPAGGRPDPPPPPPVLLVRPVDGRRTDPARGATGEASSWLGTGNPSLSVRCHCSLGGLGAAGEPVTPVQAARCSLASPAGGAGEVPVQRRPAGAAVTEGSGVTTPGPVPGATPWRPAAVPCGAAAPARARNPGRTTSRGGSSRS